MAQLPKIDVTHHQRRAVMSRNIRNIYNSASPETVERGKQWYDRVNEAVTKGVRGKSTTEFGGAGIVAAVSPNMDWEKNNISAFDELHSLKDSDFHAIAAGDRSSLQGKSINVASAGAIGRAHRIMQGESPETVLPRQTAPKTNSFTHNIAYPDQARHVTIDGRAHDIAANRMQGWQQDRGIGSAQLKSGKTSRYEHFEGAFHTATAALAQQHGGVLLPHQVQAVTWEHGKELERSVPLKNGGQRQKGVTRTGQSYTSLPGYSSRP